MALFVDSKLAACLMMSNLAAELKQHAVTLYEVRWGGVIRRMREGEKGEGEGISGGSNRVVF